MSHQLVCFKCGLLKQDSGTHQSNTLLQNAPDTNRVSGEHGSRQRRPDNEIYDQLNWTSTQTIS